MLRELAVTVSLHTLEFGFRDLGSKLFSIIWFWPRLKKKKKFRLRHPLRVGCEVLKICIPDLQKRRNKFLLVFVGEHGNSFIDKF